jgi:hypothetical protein
MVHFSTLNDDHGMEKALDKGGEFCYNLAQVDEDLARAGEKI